MTTPGNESPATPAVERSATIEVTMSLDLAENELFPDGAPANWDAKTVLAEILKSRHAQAFIDDWDLLTFGADVSVWSAGQTANGHLR